MDAQKGVIISLLCIYFIFLLALGVYKHPLPFVSLWIENAILSYISLCGHLTAFCCVHGMIDVSGGWQESAILAQKCHQYPLAQIMINAASAFGLNF